jgi:hypothetical protein
MPATVAVVGWDYFLIFLVQQLDMQAVVVVQLRTDLDA